MPRPDFILEKDIVRWSKSIDDDKSVPQEFKQSEVIKELCYSGLYLAESLTKLKCPQELILRIQFTAGKMSYGRDPWEIHLDILEKYRNNELEIEQEHSDLLN